MNRTFNPLAYNVTEHTGPIRRLWSILRHHVLLLAWRKDSVMTPTERRIYNKLPPILRLVVLPLHDLRVAVNDLRDAIALCLGRKRSW